jgi:PPP family 3-phenylpropionic acid transporter
MDFVLRGLDVNFGASRSCGSVTYALTSLGMGAVLEHFAPTLVLPVFLLSFAALLVALLLFRYPQPELPVSTSKVAPTVLSNAAMLRRYPSFSIVLVACALLISSQNAITTYMIHVVSKVGGGESAAGIAYFISGMVEMPAMLLFAKLRRKIPLRFLMLTCAFFFVLRSGSLLLATTPLAVYLGCSLQFFAYAVLSISTVYYVTEEIDTANQVKGQALIYTASSGIGAAIGSLCGGRLLDAGGANTMLTFCVLAACAGVIVMALALFARRKTPAA